MNDLDQLDQALAGGGTKAAFTKDTPVGTTVTGTVVDATVRQINDYMSGKPKTWDDGRPQMQVVVRIKTDLRDPEIENDEGIRGVFIKTWGVWKQALNEAIRDAGGSKASDVLLPGAKFTATFTGTKPSTQGDPTKLFSYKIVPPAAAGLDEFTSTAPTASATPAPAPAQATPAQPAPVDQVRQLINLGLDDTQIAGATGLDQSTVAAIRSAPAA